MTTRATPDDAVLHFGLTANAVLSLMAGIVLLAATPNVGNALGTDIDGWLRLFGVALIGHALILAWVRTSQNPVPWTWLNVAVVAPYPLLMIAVAVVVADSTRGRALVLVDGALVGTVALVQYIGIRRTRDRGSIQPAAA